MQAGADLGDLALGLHPRALAEGGLCAALEVLVQCTPCRVLLDVDVQGIPADLEPTIYYLCAEALANVTKHAGATEARVEVSSPGRRGAGGGHRRRRWWCGPRQRHRASGLGRSGSGGGRNAAGQQPTGSRDPPERHPAGARTRARASTSAQTRFSQPLRSTMPQDCRSSLAWEAGTAAGVSPGPAVPARPGRPGTACPAAGCSWWSSPGTRSSRWRWC